MNYRLLMDGMDTLEGGLIRLRKTLSDSRSANYDESVGQINKTISRLKRREDELGEARTSLARYYERR